MLNDREFEQWCDKNKLSEEAKAQIKTIREAQPSRRVGGRKNVTGKYPSRKMKCTIQFESHRVELPGVFLKEHDDDVLEYYDQPPAIKLKYKSPKEKVIAPFHTPDFFVLRKNIAGWEEWKTEEELEKLAIDSPNRYVKVNGEWRCPPGEQYATQFGLKYWLKSSNTIDWIFVDNIMYLEDYLLDEHLVIPEEAEEKVLSAVQSQPAITLAELLDIAEADIIYGMIAADKIYTDLYAARLSEPDTVHVFANEQTAKAYEVMTSRKSIPLVANKSLRVAPGIQVSWNGALWTIINVTNELISLLAEGKVVELPRKVFVNLACNERIKGVNESLIQDSADNEINEIFLKASPDDLDIALKRYKRIEPALQTGIITSDGKVTKRTLRNWINSFNFAEVEFGSGFLGLIPQIKNRGNRKGGLPEKSKEVMDKFIEEEYETPKNIEKRAAYGLLVERCKQAGTAAPCEKTFSRALRKRDQYLQVLKTKGKRTGAELEPVYVEPDFTTPKHGSRPFELAHIDHTELDIELVDSRTGKNLGRPWLTMMVDAFDRRIQAVFLSFDPPSYRSCMMVLRECVKRFNRLPGTIVVDNGREFHSQYFETFCARYGVIKKNRPPAKARFGSVMERMFETTTTQLIHNLAGNTKIMKNVRQVTKSFNPKNLALWTLLALYELLIRWAYEFYDTTEHPALGQSPREAFEAGMAASGRREFRVIPYSPDFVISTLPSTPKGTAKVDPARGVKIRYFYYSCREFQTPGVAGTEVHVRYDPWNIGIAYAFVAGKWVKCYSEHYARFKNRTEQEIKIASAELRKQMSNHSKNYEVTTKRLGEFLESAAENEEILKQRLKDAELESVLEAIDGKDSAAATEENGEFDEDDNDVEAVDDGEEFEEY